MSKTLGEMLWCMLALFAVTAIALDLARWGSERLAAGQWLLAAVPAGMLAFAALIAFMVADLGGHFRNAAHLAAVGSVLAFGAYLGLLADVL